MIRIYISQSPGAPPELVYEGSDERFAQMAIRRLIACAPGASGCIERDGTAVWYRGEWMPDEPAPY